MDSRKQWYWLAVLLSIWTIATVCDLLWLNGAGWLQGFVFGSTAYHAAKSLGGAS